MANLSDFLEITAVSENFIETNNLNVLDVSRVVIPLRLPAKCQVFYKAKRTTTGVPMAVWINGEPVPDGLVRFDNESGLKRSEFSLDSLLQKGLNEVRVKCLVSCPPLSNESDDGLFWLRKEDSTVIYKAFSTKGTLEPFDQTWQIWVH